ncbi:ABC-2 transporter permease [Niallia oryzisoli]|uniref:ABC-2 transporter permease n=1 Tax=Niallia oryzisoli TaxID=1737571 RepID=A0ABZ2CD59_9BACI
MYHLIKKDFLMQKKALKLSILLMLFFSITLVHNLGTAGLSVGIIAITYQLVLGTSALEDKDNSDMILVSLPIKKNKIVLSKYVSIYIFAAYAILVYFIIALMANLFNLPLEVPITGMEILIALLAVTLFFSISFPLVFKYGYLKSKMVNLILFFIVVFGGTPIISNIMNDEKLSQSVIEFIHQRSDTHLTILILIPLVLILVISYLLSLTFYKNREF